MPHTWPFGSQYTGSWARSQVRPVCGSPPQKSPLVILVSGLPSVAVAGPSAIVHRPSLGLTYFPETVKTVKQWTRQAPTDPQVAVVRGVFGATGARRTGRGPARRGGAGTLAASPRTKSWRCRT